MTLYALIAYTNGLIPLLATTRRITNY